MGRPPKIGRGKGRECLGKTPYTKTEAEERAWHKSKTYLMRWSAYSCRHCGHWHIGHSNRGADRHAS
jgi:hypothetical protein